MSFTKQTRIEGQNASGKTSVADAYTWLLFGKDTLDRSESSFGIKPLDEEGNEILNTETSVAAMLLVDDKEVELKRVRKERWVKQTGSLEATHEGHTTNYYVDGVPSKKKEYDAFVSGIVDEELFKLLTQPHYFAERVSWQDRRKTLLDMAGAVTDLEIARKDKRFVDLVEVLKERTIEDYKKILTERRKKLKKDLEHIPTRVDEARRSLPDVEGVESAKSEVERIESEIKKLDARISSIENGQALKELENKLTELENKEKAIQNELESELVQKGITLSTERQTKSAELMRIEQQIQTLKDENKRMADENARAKEEQSALRDEWLAINGEEFEHNDECVCPTCEQELPTEKVEAARNKALGSFNLDKSKRLERVTERGKALGVEITEREQQAKVNEQKLNELNGQLATKAKEIEVLDAEIQKARDSVKIARNDERIKAVRVDKAEVEQEVESLKQDVSKSLETLKSERATLEESKKEHQSTISLLALKEQTEKRIAELESEQKGLATQYENVERELHMIDEFVEFKVNTLTGAINDKFESVTWKLFERQVNGALKETCEALYNGVPYNAGLNTGARIKAGLDIVDALSTHYETSAPVWVDNAEAVTDTLESKSQLIELHAVAGIDTITVQ